MNKTQLFSLERVGCQKLYYMFKARNMACSFCLLFINIYSSRCVTKTNHTLPMCWFILRVLETLPFHLSARTINRSIIMFYYKADRLLSNIYYTVFQNMLQYRYPIGMKSGLFSDNVFSSYFCLTEHHIVPFIQYLDFKQWDRIFFTPSCIYKNMNHLLSTTQTLFFDTFFCCEWLGTNQNQVLWL